MSNNSVLETLKQAMSKAEPCDTEAHKDIYTFIQETFGQLSANDETIPFPQLAYGIRRILYPEFLLARIPELLELLWHVDIYRRRVVAISQDILTWQKFYAKDEAIVTILNAREEKKIKEFADEKKACQNRETYTHVAIRCCKLHIHYLFTASESYLLPARLLDFFPSLRREDTRPTSQFHWDFSETERRTLDEAAQECLYFVKEATEWEHDRELHWKENDLPMENFLDDYEDRSFKGEFALAFDPPDKERAIQLIEMYLKKVEKMTEKLEVYFPSA